jgi:hypothetical protein
MNKIIKYEAAPGAQFNDEQAQKYGERISKLSDGDIGSVKPIDVVDDASKDNSPLHDYFEWDNKVASEHYRLSQARDLLSHLVVIIKVKNGKVIKQKAYFNVIEGTDDKATRVYVSLGKTFTTKELTQQVIEMALREMIDWQERYRQYKQLSIIFKAIDKVKKKIRV